MPITKGSRAAHERSLKAAETRRRNQANGPRIIPVTTHVPRGGSRNVKKMSLSELTGEYERNREEQSKYWRNWTSEQREKSSRRHYRLKDEINNRYAKERYGETHLEAGKRFFREAKATEKAKKHRAAAKKKNPVAHRKDLEGADRRLSDAYERARTPEAKRKITARLKRIHREMGKRYYGE